MFILYAFLTTILSTFLGLVYIKTFQLENYKIKKYFIKAIKFQFSLNGKNKLIFTFRIKRLIILDFLINFGIFLIIFYFLNNYYVFIPITLFVFFKHFFIIFSYLLSMPIEEYIKKNYIKKAKSKLAKIPCKKIAITGSFGKTSTKNILYQILKEEFDVCATPKSFNTPMGVCRTILENLKETDDFFIVEFGARHKGDIEFLANFVGVDFGIITPIGNCHLETFGSIENIENTKYELCEQVKDIVVFNGKSESSKKLFNRYKKRKYLVCENNSFAYAKNIKTFDNGSKFDLILNDKVFHCQTKLLGKSNIDNIVTSCAMAYLLGENPYNIINAIKKLTPTPHRLELIKSDFVTIIDDSYNSNFEGFCQALEVLNNFNGRKIVVSPGVIELGESQYLTNLRLSQKVCNVADIFVIMNKTNKEALLSGAENFAGKIYFANTRQDQKLLLKQIIKKGDIILFENDLPDNFR